MATANSTAPPKVISPLTGWGMPSKTIRLKNKVRRSKAAIITRLTLSRFLIPNKIQRAIPAPAITLHTAFPQGTKASAEVAAVAIMTAVQPIN